MGVSGILVAAVTGATALGISMAAIPFVTPALRRVCIPYVPATPQQLANLSRALTQARCQGPLIDLGSGDGRVVLLCAEMGFKSTGVELNSILVLCSVLSAYKKGLRTRATFHRMDIFKTSINEYNTAVIFGAESMMADLIPKLSQMLSGTSLLACRFPLPENESWRQVGQIGEGIDTVWVYKKL